MLLSHHALACLRGCAQQQCIHSRTWGLQRFGVEGCEALLVGLEALVARCAGHGVRRIELGMPHRSALQPTLMLCS